ncbi:hypothetical protein [Winogradskyella endarachnes]|uniref:Uncharacterized protein n=1 Tax=Winogradskyella endarachnes TaxID=2681965 RepID=A0A6L6U9S2_9FLAO|nr:hypothetical protein [Winogradskyella endarachnes]MUU78928.1 hypothetical protein [Winogradskyella endarachnes]
MKKYYKYFAVLTALVLFNCQEDLESDLSNFVGFEEGPVVYTVDNSSTLTLDVTVAASEVANSDRTYSIYVDEDNSDLLSSYSVPSTVTIPAGTNLGTVSVSVTDDENLGFVTQTLVLDFVDEADTDFGDPVTLEFTETCLDTIVTFYLTLDTWPDETTWEIYDLSDLSAPIASGGPYINPDDDFAELSFDYCLASGDYGVVVYDSYGDGGPTYSVSIGDTVLVAETTLAGYNSSATFSVD